MGTGDEPSCHNEECVRFLLPGTGNIVRNGTYLTKSGRVRKYVCRACGRSFCERKGKAAFDLRSDDARLLLPLFRVLEGASLRSVSRELGVKLDTVRSWVGRARRHRLELLGILAPRLGLRQDDAEALWDERIEGVGRARRRRS